jgi:hypothetical protein
MIEIPALIAVLAAEAIVALSGLLILLGYRRSRKKRLDRAEAGRFIDRVNETGESRLAELYAALAPDGGPPSEPWFRTLLEEIMAREKAIYRQAFEAFLNRDAARLAEIDAQVRELAEPYCRLIEQWREKLPKYDPTRDLERIDELQAEVLRTRAEADHARAELALALESLEDVSAEYAKMFGSRKTADQLQASLGRVLGIFRRTTQAAGEEPSPDPLDGHDFPGREAT